MKNTTLLTLFFVTLTLLVSCQSKPSKVEVLRAEKAQRDLATYEQAQRTLAYSDSLLQLLMPQADSLLHLFRYEKNDRVEDHGHYVHRLLQTGNNTSRCFLQAYVSDDRRTTLQSYYYGNSHIQHNTIRLSVGELFVSKEGSCHSFDVEGAHEIVTVMEDDARELLQFIATNFNERILVTAQGTGKTTYYLQSNEKQALAETFQLAVLMNDIAKLEQAIRVSSMQIDKYEKRQEKQEK